MLSKKIWTTDVLKPSQSGEEQQEGEKERLSIIFTLKNQVGGLVRALQAFQDLGINVQHIESRPSQSGDNQVNIVVKFLTIRYILEFDYPKTLNETKFQTYLHLPRIYKY